jgi:predicted small lipoprotein YifL
MNGGRERTKARATRFGVGAALGATLVVLAACGDEGPLAPAAQTPVAAPQVAPSETASQSLVRPIMKAAGLATDVDPPPDFVVQSRPARAPASIPAFATPDEPPGKIENVKGLDAVDADLAAAAKVHDALRAAYPPSAKAVADEAAAKKAKSKDKAPPSDASQNKPPQSDASPPPL